MTNAESFTRKLARDLPSQQEVEKAGQLMHHALQNSLRCSRVAVGILEDIRETFNHLFDQRSTYPMNRKQIRGFAVACFAITASTLLLATEPAARDDPNSILLQYGEFLRSEAKEHRDFLQTYYTIILAGLGTIAAVFGALLTWLNWRTKKEIQAQINATFAGTVGQLVESQAKEFETFLKSTRNRIETQSKQLETQSKQLDRQEEVIRALAVFSMASYIFDHLRGIYEGSREPQREYLFRKNERLSEIFAIWLSMAT